MSCSNPKCECVELQRSYDISLGVAERAHESRQEYKARLSLVESALEVLEEIRPKIPTAKYPELCQRIDALLKEAAK